MEKDRKVTLEMLRQDAEEARERAIKKQALPEGQLKEDCLWALYVAKQELAKRDYGDTITIRITGLSGRQEYSVGSVTLNLESLPSIKDIRKVLKKVPALQEMEDQCGYTQLVLRFA